jgi:dihydroorotase
MEGVLEEMWIINGEIWDDEREEQYVAHLEIVDGKIAQIVKELPDGVSAEHREVIDAAGKFVSPGFIDMHVHLRDPGLTYKEDIVSGTRSAVAGGFTTIACMPNTKPVTDTPEVVRYILDKAATEGVCKVLPYAAITTGQQGTELTDFAALKAAGAVGFTDDGVGVQNAGMMKRAMTAAAALKMPVIAHCEENDLLVPGAWATDGKFARQHGLPGIPNESESIQVGRDALLAEATGVHYHVCHVSTEQSVRIIRKAKEAGVRITAEACPHHLLLSDEDIPGMDTNWKMNPPLRSPRDVAAVIKGVEDGTIDLIVTDHAPHSAEEKARPIEDAPFGIVGFETAFALLYTKFVRTGRWHFRDLLENMTWFPATIFHLDQGKLYIGAPADLTVLDLDTPWTVDPEKFYTKGRNTPFAGWELYGLPVLTIVDGKEVYRHESFSAKTPAQ